MKYRKDFVTNSSSSSFVCEICGEVGSGWDAIPSDVGMCECENGHVFCDEHMLDDCDRQELIKNILGNEWNESTEEELNNMDNYELCHNCLDDNGCRVIPESVCPICQFIEYSQDDLARYLLNKYRVPRDEVFKEVKKVNKRRKKLYDSEYIAYVCQKFDLQPAQIVGKWKQEFGSYRKFKDFLVK